MHQRDHLKRIAIISGKETDWAAYKHTKNGLNIAVKISKASYYRNYFLQNKGNIRETWRGINTILSKNTKTTSFPSKLEGINSVNLSPNDVSNAFNNHFVEVGPNLGKQISQSPVDFSSFITPAESTFELVDLTVAEIAQIIQALPTNKASDLDGIPVALLKIGAPVIEKSLTHIFNLSINRGILPTDCKSISYI